MNKTYIEAKAKINLTLNITEKLETGYHNIDSVFQPISLYDELYISKNNENKLIFNCNKQYLNNKKNIIVKAYNKLILDYPQIKGITVDLIKHIPSEAGLGGGSSDCSSFLIAINKLFNLNLNTTQLISIAKTLGADVTPCLFDRALIATGIGDQIKDIDTISKYYLVLIKPNLSFSTKEMYKKLDKTVKFKKVNNSKNVIQALETDNIEELALNIYNIFEEAITDIPEIQNLKKILIEQGALNSLMSGSGSVVFGIFKDKITAKTAYDNLKKDYKTYLCYAYNKIK